MRAPINITPIGFMADIKAARGDMLFHDSIIEHCHVGGRTRVIIDGKEATRRVRAVNLRTSFVVFMSEPPAIHHGRLVTYGVQAGSLRVIMNHPTLGEIDLVERHATMLRMMTCWVLGSAYERAEIVRRIGDKHERM